jgi:hypothetical protein
MISLQSELPERHHNILPIVIFGKGRSMNKLIIVMTFAFSAAYSQATDSLINHSSVFNVRIDSLTGTPVISIKPQPGMRQPSIVTHGSISFATTTLERSILENLIRDLESSECNAIKKRDHAWVQRLWARDFTLDHKQNEVVASNNAMPYYAIFERFIERITVIDSTSVFTSGYEYTSEIKSADRITPRTMKPYFHAWTKKYGLWKLTSKR